MEEDGFNPSTSGLWASAAPLCYQATQMGVELIMCGLVGQCHYVNLSIQNILRITVQRGNKHLLEDAGIDPATSHMLSERSPI